LIVVVIGVVLIHSIKYGPKNMSLQGVVIK